MARYQVRGHFYAKLVNLVFRNHAAFFAAFPVLMAKIKLEATLAFWSPLFITVEFVIVSFRFIFVFSGDGTQGRHTELRPCPFFEIHLP